VRESVTGAAQTKSDRPRRRQLPSAAAWGLGRVWESFRPYIPSWRPIRSGRRSRRQASWYRQCCFSPRRSKPKLPASRLRQSQEAAALGSPAAKPGPRLFVRTNLAHTPLSSCPLTPRAWPALVLRLHNQCLAMHMGSTAKLTLFNERLHPLGPWLEKSP